MWRALKDLKADGAVGGLGISAYAAEDPVNLAERFRPDVMQVPFSLLDQRLLRDGSLARLKKLGVEVHARSLFLQGLLFMDRPPEKLAQAAPHAGSGQGAGQSCVKTTLLDAALGFVLSRSEVDFAVIGVTGWQQLEEILAAVAAPAPALDWEACALNDVRLLTPSLW